MSGSCNSGAIHGIPPPLNEADVLGASAITDKPKSANFASQFPSTNTFACALNELALILQGRYLRHEDHHERFPRCADMPVPRISVRTGGAPSVRLDLVVTIRTH